ncbi:MAG: S8 family serine peptidase [Acidobacteria bacterium]|nr:S8 family serine peptidase [Acidobacteriota bacterium]
MKRLLIAMSGAALAVAASTSALGIVSQGAFRMGADAAWARGIDGAGTRVAVLDTGFGGLDESIAAGELPPRDQMETKSFDPVHGLEGRDNLGAPTQHGTRMAEIVRDVAPGARLVLVNYAGIDGFLQAADWIAANGIPVVSHSNSLLGGPFDGTGPLARAVDAAAGRGVLWVNSGGNFAERHWRGVPSPAGTELPIAPQPGETLSFGLGWTDPALKAVLSVQRQQADGSWSEVVVSDTTRRTDPVAVDGGAWRLVVTRTQGPDAPVDVFSRTVGFGSVAVPDGSVATPGDAAGALSVGAVPWQGTDPAKYSSRGPTADGRAKPDLVGPTYVTANALFPGTAGTSAATAHVAGIAALVRDERVSLGQPIDVVALRADITGRARDLGAPGADAGTGAGMARFDVVAPRIGVTASPGRASIVRVRAFDDGTVQSVSLRVNGRAVRTAAGPYMRQQVGLRTGRNRVEVVARDLAGNESTVARVLVRRDAKRR